VSVIPKQNGAKLFRVWPDCPQSQWDAIVVGSGMGGLSCAAALANQGNRVLVLERHFVPGGYTHMFARKEFEWDVGVHAIGEMRPCDVPRKILDWLTAGSVEMEPLGDPYDRFHFPDEFNIDFPSTRKGFRESLITSFPEQQDKIDAYLKLVRKVSKYSQLFYACKSLPFGLARILTWVQHLFYRDWWGMTTSEVFDELGIEGRLRLVLAGQWGYIGETVDRSSFPVQALVQSHFRNGAWYPVGGAKVFAEGMLAQIRAAGGECVVRAEVSEVLEKGNRVVGVKLADGTEIPANKVISAAGAKTTVGKLVSEKLRTSRWGQEILSIQDSPSYLCLNLGFKGDIAKAGASRANRWFFRTWEETTQYWNAEDSEEKAPILYVSFPSLKNPKHNSGPEGIQTGECVTFVPWDLFERWRESEYGNRSEDYKLFKEALKERMLSQLREVIPDVMQHMVYADLSTPLSASHFANASQGAIYGLAATPDRYGCSALRSRTPLRGLHLTGVDPFSLGVVGAMMAGCLTAASLDWRIYRRLI